MGPVAVLFSLVTWLVAEATHMVDYVIAHRIYLIKTPVFIGDVDVERYPWGGCWLCNIAGAVLLHGWTNVLNLDCIDPRSIM
ncbi:hypothetical protein F5X98DRAFT_337031, partial [Xylaria grammica]